MAASMMKNLFVLVELPYWLSVLGKVAEMLWTTLSKFFCLFLKLFLSSQRDAQSSFIPQVLQLVKNNYQKMTKKTKKTCAKMNTKWSCRPIAPSMIRCLRPPGTGD
jgi:hypothetical protein